MSPTWTVTPPMTFSNRAAREIRRVVYERDNFACRECDWHPPCIPPYYDGRETVMGRDTYLTLDHILPRSLGGPSTVGNLRTLCQSCNSRKCARIGGRTR